MLNGETVYQQSFDVPYSDPAVQAAVTQANAVLAANGATAGLPALTSSEITDEIPYTATMLTGEQIASPTVTVNTYFGPGQIFGVMDINGAPNSTFTLESGQVDINTNLDYQQTIDQTVTTTTTQLTTQDYTITGTPAVTGPVITGTYTAPQTETDGQPFNAFGNVTITDAGSSGAETATITMTYEGAATDYDGTLTGAGLSKTATGTYTLTASSPAALQTALRAVVFTPAFISAATYVANSGLVTGLTLQVSDGAAAPVTDTNTVIDTVLGPQTLTASVIPVSGQSNAFVSATRTGETVDATTPVNQTESVSATNITAVLNGETVYQQSFDLPYSDPMVQAAVAQANEILAADGATASLPALTSSQITDETPQTTTVITGQETASPVPTTTTIFGPQPVFTGLDINGTPNTSFSLLAGQTDTNVNFDYQTTIDQTVTTTTTQLTTQDYTITGEVECFAAGTRIMTPRGEIPVEALQPGDVICSKSGNAAVKWVGRRRIDCRLYPKPAQIWPFQISAGAFGPGKPERDLRLSPDHAVFTEGVLIPIKYLENGTTIRQIEVAQVEYIHVELDRHCVIYAENLPCESYLDIGNRNAFANGGMVTQLHPQFGLAAGYETIWESAGCAPLVTSGGILVRVAAQLRGRAVALGHKQAAKIRARRVPALNAATGFSGLLNPGWYLSTYPDIADAGADTADHYRNWGWQEGRLPCPEIDLIRALGLVDPFTAMFTMPDVLAAGADPVAHFCKFGWREQRRPNLYFDPAWYVRTYDVPAETNPLLHYALHGERQGFRPSLHFDPVWYRERYGTGYQESPLAHYLKHRRSQRFSPLPAFDIGAYRKRQASTLLPNRDAYAHFLAFGHLANDPTEFARRGA